MEGINMVDLSYFKLGISSDTIKNYLSNYTGEKKDISPLILDDAREIITKSITAGSEKEDFIKQLNYSRQYNNILFVPLIFSIYSHINTVEKLLENLKTVLNTLDKIEKIEKPSKDDMTHTIDFFDRLSSICIEKMHETKNVVKLELAY